MKIAVVGCGAVGSYYGAMLTRAGQDVHFLLRSDYETVRHRGVSIRSPAGDFSVRPACANRPQDIGPSELVLIALKTTANGEYANLLPPLVGPHTAIVTLQNGLGNEEQLAALFPVGQILGGLCFVCLNRLSSGVIQHLDHGMIVLGEFQRPSGPRTREIAGVIRQAGVPCRVSENLALAHWEKLIWNVPFNGLGVASAAGYESFIGPGSRLPVSGLVGPCLATDQLLADVRWEQLVRELMIEVITTANSLGLGVAESLGEEQIKRTRTMGSYKASTLVDFEQGRPLELETLFLEPMRQAQRAGVPTPRLARLCEVLGALDARR